MKKKIHVSRAAAAAAAARTRGIRKSKVPEVYDSGIQSFRYLMFSFTYIGNKNSFYTKNRNSCTSSFFFY